MSDLQEITQEYDSEIEVHEVPEAPQEAGEAPVEHENARRTAPYQEEVHITKLFTHFGIDEPGQLTMKMKAKLEEITDFILKEKNPDQRVEDAIRELEEGIGRAPMDIDRITHIYNYIKIKKDARRHMGRLIDYEAQGRSDF